MLLTLQKAAYEILGETWVLFACENTIRDEISAQGLEWALEREISKINKIQELILELS